MSTDEPLLSVRGLQTRFATSEGVVRAVDGVDFAVDRGETVCVVGESGSGKTVACESITRLLPTPPGTIDGEVWFDGRDLVSLSEPALRDVRGNRIAHVFQNPENALDPVYTVGDQLAEVVRRHTDATGSEARQRVVMLLDQVGIPNPATRVDDYPHEFSGGMTQRAVIAMALAAEPDLLVADEPTTALDVTIQAQILELLTDLTAEREMGLLFVTHDLGVVAEIADRVVVMYAGKVMERGSVFDVFERPAHPYTKALFECLPDARVGGESDGIEGTLPPSTDPPDGCRFHPRCNYAIDACTTSDQPPLGRVEDGGDASDHRASCVYYQEPFDASVLDDEPEASESVD